MASGGKKVVILGGGVAGLSAAHELVERSFEVEVYERNPELGGKARSFDLPNTVVGSGNPLPGEHGFRFFPGFYRHVTDTMKRIPESGAWQADGRSVHDHLYPVPWIYLDRRKFEPARLLTALPRTPHSWQHLLRQLSKQYFVQAGFAEADIELLALRLWQVATSCEARRRDIYERMTWSEFMTADDMLSDPVPRRGTGASGAAPEQRDGLVQILLRALVAAKSKEANAKVVGEIAIQILVRLFGTRSSADYVLDGPTSEVWIRPWQRFLESKGVMFHCRQEVIRVNYANRRILSATCREVDAQGRPLENSREVSGDYFLLALPVEAAARLLSEDRDTTHVALMDADLQLWDILALGLSQEDFNETKGRYGALQRYKGAFRIRPHTDWMVGIQLYFKAPIPLVTTSELSARREPASEHEHLGPETGHVIYLDSPWALTAIEQPRSYRLGKRGDGSVKQIISVIISEWDQPGHFNGTSAKRCTADEIYDEVLQEIVFHAMAPSERTNGSRGAGDARPSHEERVLVRQRAQELRLTHGAAQPYFLNPDLVLLDQPDENGRLWRNRAPLFINNTNSWHLQPHATTKIPNLFLAADYVRTFTQLATMEAANEAARRAVNGIILAEGRRRSAGRGAWTPNLHRRMRLLGVNVRGARSADTLCEVWSMSDPWFLWIYRLRDSWAYHHGQPWQADLPVSLRLVRRVALWLYQLARRLGLAGA